VDRQCIRAIACDRLEDGISGFGPDEGLWIIIVGFDECRNVGLEIADAVMDATLDLLFDLAVGARSCAMGSTARR
jgi:hypothetical protein